MKLFKFSFLVLAMLVMPALSGCATVGTGYRGVVLNWDKPTGEVKGEGIYFYNPVGTSIQDMNVQLQAVEVQADAVSKDLQQVQTKIVVNYSLDPSKVVDIYDTMRTDYDDRVIGPSVQETIKQQTAKYTASELIEKRSLVHQGIETGLQERLKTYGILVQNVSVTDFKFTDSFQKAVEDKVAAQQALLTAQIQKQTAIQQAEGAAEAQKLQKQTVTPLVVRLKELEIQKSAIDKWDGHLPDVTGNSIPMIQLGSGGGAGSPGAAATEQPAQQ